MQKSLSVFIAYSHRDRALREELEAHLSNLKRQNIISSWYDGDIVPGTEWEAQILEHLKTAQIILLLISADFMASDFCYSIEMKQAIARHEAGETCVIPIVLRPTDLKGAPFAKLKMLPTDAKAVTRWPRHDDAFEDIVRGIHKVLDYLAEKNVLGPLVSSPDQEDGGITSTQLANLPAFPGSTTPITEISLQTDNSTHMSGRQLRRSIEDPSGGHSLILKVLSQYPQLLVKWLSWRSGAPSKSLCNIQFNDVVIDIAVGMYLRTLGQWEWKIVLIGDPHASYFSKDGTQTVELGEALERANTIKAAIQSDLRKLRSILPDVQTETSIIVLMGRRKDVSETDKKKISLLRLSTPGVVLNSFDAILDSL